MKDKHRWMQMGYPYGSWEDPIYQSQGKTTRQQIYNEYQAKEAAQTPTVEWPIKLTKDVLKAMLAYYRVRG